MGHVIQFSDYKTKERGSEVLEHRCLIPIEFGVGNADFFHCMELIARYGTGTVQVKPVSEESEDIVYLMQVGDALKLNRRLLEAVELSDEEIAERIDLIQMLENINTPLLETIWSAFYRRSSTSH